MNFIKNLDKQLDELHLLKHPLYEDWSAGTLSIETLRLYAEQYYHHVAAFPRYVSSIHSLCSNIADRQILLDNLIEEEKGSENHPELWLRFAEGLGLDKKNVEASEATLSKDLVDGYFNLVRSDFATGLGALYAYERQTPEVAKSKIDGLKKFYNLDDERSLKFFVEHIGADDWHSDECASIINKLDPDSQEKAKKGATTAARLLWEFLDNIYVSYP
jgi:pyrroloquinoline-quinone synthase